MSTRSNPFDDLERLFDRMSRQFEDVSRRWEFREPFGMWSTEMEAMAVDMIEHDDEFIVTVDLPGFERDEVTLRVSNHTLRIDAEHEEAVEEEEEEYLRHERRHESQHRSITLPADVDGDNVTARMKNGVLTITLPKLEGEETRTVEIE